MHFVWVDCVAQVNLMEMSECESERKIGVRDFVCVGYLCIICCMLPNCVHVCLLCVHVQMCMCVYSNVQFPMMHNVYAGKFHVSIPWSI